MALIGIDPVEADKISEISQNMLQGDIASIQGGKRIVMGQALASKLKVKMGDTVSARFPDAVPVNLIVSGIFSFGYKPVDEGVTYVSLETARGFLDEGDVVTTIEIKLKRSLPGPGCCREVEISWLQCQRLAAALSGYRQNTGL